LPPFAQSPGYCFLIRFRQLKHEAYIQPQQSAPQSDAWISCTHGDEERPRSIGTSPRQGPQAPHSLILGPRTSKATGTLPNRRLGFSAANRIVEPGTFKSVRLRGKRFSDALMRVNAKRNDLTYPRLGLAIATKTLGTAVARNRLKRIVRESFRLNQHRLPAVDITVAAAPAARGAQAVAIRASLDKFWTAISQQCAAS
jgi:ribonuclease P protein component